MRKQIYKKGATMTVLHSWDKEEIRNLRLKLGWTHGEMGRRLSCHEEEVYAWEAGEMPPHRGAISLLEFYRNQLDTYIEEVFVDPRAELLMEQSLLEQVDIHEIEA